MSEPKNTDTPFDDPADQYDATAVHLSGVLRDHSNHTLGNLLTAVEASLGDSKQAEALKSIVRKEIFYMIDRNQAEVYVRAKMQRTGLEPVEVEMFSDKDGNFEAHSIRKVTES